MGQVLPVPPQWPLSGGGHSGKGGSEGPADDDCREQQTGLQPDRAGRQSRHRCRGPDRAAALRAGHDRGRGEDCRAPVPGTPGEELHQDRRTRHYWHHRPD